MNLLRTSEIQKKHKSEIQKSTNTCGSSRGGVIVLKFTRCEKSRKTQKMLLFLVVEDYNLQQVAKEKTNLECMRNKF